MGQWVGPEGRCTVRAVSAVSAIEPAHSEENGENEEKGEVCIVAAIAPTGISTHIHISCHMPITDTDTGAV